LILPAFSPKSAFKVEGQLIDVFLVSPPWTSNITHNILIRGGVIEKYAEVQPLVFGHYDEINKTFSALIESLGRAIAARHHRPFGWKNANAGISRARAGVMRRISMAILRATAQHLLSGLGIIGPQSIYASEAHRRQTPDERERG
jgi:hypothetical protein